MLRRAAGGQFVSKKDVACVALSVAIGHLVSHLLHCNLFLFHKGRTQIPLSVRRRDDLLSVV